MRPPISAVRQFWTVPIAEGHSWGAGGGTGIPFIFGRLSGCLKSA